MSAENTWEAGIVQEVVNEMKIAPKSDQLLLRCYWYRMMIAKGTCACTTRGKGGDDCEKYLRIKELWFEEVLYKAKMLEIEINEIPTKSTTYSAWRAVCIEFILISTF